MHRLLLAILIATAWVDAYPQSSLPPCPTDTSVIWTNCFGRVIHSSGQMYVGEIRDGKWNGQGTYTWPNGDKYVGEYRDGTPNGQGTYSWRDGRKYVGEWKDGKMQGRGTLTYYDSCAKGLAEPLPMRETLPAGWSNLKCQVRGLFGDPLFETYIGDFEDGLRTGFGTYYSSKGEILKQGVWSRNSFIEAKTEAQFRYEQDLMAQEKVRTEKRELLTKLLGEINASLLQIERETQERRRIEIDGDGSEDDQACKSRKLKPSTAPYKKCRSDLVAIREARLLKEKQLAEMREVKRLEQAKIAQRQKEKQERTEIERQRLLALQKEKALEAAERRKRQREDAAAKDPFFYTKQQCRELGFKDKTEKFGTCVLELSKRVATESNSSVATTARSDDSPDDKTCIGYGYAIGTTGYADCRLKLDQARQQYERELAGYEAEKAEYDRRAAAIKRENELRAAEALSQYGLCFASCGTDYLACATRCGSGSAGVSRSAGPPPVQPSGFSTLILNGKIISCSRLGSIVTCN